MKINCNVFLTACLVILSASCRQHETSPDGSSPVPQFAIQGIEMADTITYQVIIRNPNPGDTWTTRCLSGLNRKAFVDSIFNMVYDSKLTAYNRETHEKLTLKQMKDLEGADGYSRDKIGMIQFTEAWYLDPATQSMSKKVLAMELGYEHYSRDGELLGYKPLFRVEM